MVWSFYELHHSTVKLCYGLVESIMVMVKKANINRWVKKTLWWRPLTWLTVGGDNQPNAGKVRYFPLVKQKCRISVDVTGAADTLILINYRFLPGISVTYGTRATGSHIQHQRDSVGRTADYTWLDFSPDFHPKPRWPSAQEYFPHRWKSREGFNFTFTRGSEGSVSAV